jgi:hypothetical protein
MTIARRFLCGQIGRQGLRRRLRRNEAGARQQRLTAGALASGARARAAEKGVPLALQKARQCCGPQSPLMPSTLPQPVHLPSARLQGTRSRETHS